MTGEPKYAGTEERTERSVVRVRYQSLERGELVRYLEPGEVIDLPADRVKVEALGADNSGNSDHAERTDINGEHITDNE